MKRALITGITGQDGSYLAELLLRKEYEVYGIIRRSSSFNTGRIDHIYKDPHDKDNRLHLVYGDLTDSSNVNKIINDIRPDEVYNFGAQSHVKVSFEVPLYTANVDALGTLRILEAIKTIKKEIRFYQAASSEMFGKATESPQTESTPFHPRSPYGCSKVFAYWATVNYRESYDIFACNGILFNHESPRRGETFVTRKITRAIASIKARQQGILYLGNLEAKRDWGFAGDYVEAVWMMLQQEKPDDFIIATGESHTVREFLEEAFRYAGFNIESNGKKDSEEEYIDLDTGKPIVRIDPKYFRPAEVDYLLGSPKKAKEKLKWKPKVKFKDLVKLMVDADMAEMDVL